MLLSRTYYSVTANKSITSRQQVCCVAVVEFGKPETTRHNRQRTFITDLLYGETGVMDFGLISMSEVRTCKLLGDSSGCGTMRAPSLMTIRELGREMETRRDRKPRADVLYGCSVQEVYAISHKAE